MRRYLHIIVYLFMACGGYAQGGEPVDSLEQRLEIEMDDTARVNLLNRIAETYRYIDAEGILRYAGEALELSQDINYRKGIAMAYNNIGTYFRLKGIYNEAADYHFNALQVMEELKDDRGIARCYNQIGILYLSLENYDLSLEYFTKALEMNYAQNDRQWIAGNSNNLAIVYQEKGEYEKALEYLMKSLEMNIALGNRDWVANNYGNIGSLYLLMGNEESLDYFKKRLEINEERKNTAGIAFTLGLIGDYYIKTGQPGEALPHLHRAYELAHEAGSLPVINNTTELLAKAYTLLDDFESALRYEKMNKLYSDSLKLAESTERITRLQMQYSHKKTQETDELNDLKFRMIQTAVAVVLFFVLVFILLLLNRQRIRAKQVRLMQEKLGLKNRTLQEELEFKEKMLQDNIKYLLDINDMLAQTINKFDTLKLSSKPENKKVIREVISILQSGINDDVWKEFEVRFNSIHRDFYDRLNAHFPDLTPNEKKLCAFLKLNMTTKEIAAITSMSEKSIETARSRLRKKLKIEKKSTSLVSFFENF